MLAQEWTLPHGQMLAYGQRCVLAGETMLARDRYQDGQRYGQGENIMSPLHAVLRIDGDIKPRVEDVPRLSL